MTSHREVGKERHHGAGRALLAGLSLVGGLALPQTRALAAPSGGGGYAWSGGGCTASACHAGVEPIRNPDSEMFQQLVAEGRKYGDRDGCVPCHGGDPAATTAEAAHQGAPASLTAAGGPKGFYADPASPWVNAETCGRCHPKLVQAQWASLMMTESGKIQGTAWAFGGKEGYEHTWANYDREDPEDPHDRLGTDAYRAYMEARKAAQPNVYPSKQTALPPAPTAAEVAADPSKAFLTYQRAECQRCHLGVKGRPRRGDFRGMGCGACHIPYGNEGLYEGGDQAIPHTREKGEPGRPLVHTIQSTRDAPVTVHGVTYTGIPVETCTTCHNRGKRIGVSYQGLMESAYDSPFTEGGGGQIGLHSKHYVAMEKDIHYQKGMLCQDCHTSIDHHGDGFGVGTNLAAVEIECADCHGTPDRYPWELPLGYSDERVNDGGRVNPDGPPRGVATEVPARLHQGWVAPLAQPSPDDDGGDTGYLLTARGNPMPEVVRHGTQVVVHTAGGKDLTLNPLKRLVERDEMSHGGRVAMVNVASHMDQLECYTCHSSWAPQCYGCHVEVRYDQGAHARDWLAGGHGHLDPAHRADPDESQTRRDIPGHVTEKRSYLRWEDPVLGNNGEGRITPLIPGCQVAVTVVGEDGKDVVRNHFFRTPPGTEGGGEEGQIGSDMSPVHPHTVGRSRSCTSCHASAKALGYGMDGVRGAPDRNQPVVIDLTTADGTVLPKSARPQVEAMPGLDGDWAAVVTPDGRQLQTVGHHFQGEGPLTAAQRARVDRRGTCEACHQEIPSGSLAVSALHHVASMMGALPADAADHAALVHKVVLTSAWAQVGGAAAAAGLLLALALWWRRRRRAAARRAAAPPTP